MRRAHSFRPLLALLAIVFMSTMTVAAEGDKPKATTAESDKPKAKAKKDDGLQGYYSIIAKELSFTEDQKKQLQAAVVERNAELKKWDEANAAKVTELTEAEKKAKEANDAAGAKKAGDELKTLKKSRTVIEDGTKAKLQSLLTAEQKSHLQGYNLYVGAMTKFSKAELTEEQKNKVKTIALEAGKGLSPDLKGKDLTKPRDELAAKVEKDVLTQTQRDTLAKLAAEKAKPKEKAKGEPAKSDGSGK